jgi:hypothetical protein
LLTPQILEHHHRIGGLAVADHGRPARAARGIKLGQTGLKNKNGNFESTIQISYGFLFIKEPFLWKAKNVRADTDSIAAFLGDSPGDRMELPKSEWCVRTPQFSFKYLPDDADNEPMEPYEVASEANPSHRQLCRSQWKLIPCCPERP